MCGLPTCECECGRTQQPLGMPWPICSRRPFYENRNLIVPVLDKRQFDINLLSVGYFKPVQIWAVSRGIKIMNCINNLQSNISELCRLVKSLCYANLSDIYVNLSDSFVSKYKYHCPVNVIEIPTKLSDKSTYYHLTNQHKDLTR